jgi:hypothetical protein
MKIFDIINEGEIDYTKPGPITQSSLGQKLEYGVPVNDQGQFYNPNKIPNYEQLTDVEYSAMTTAYKTWLRDYLTRWPNAKQQPDGTWRGTQPFGSAPIKFETYNHGFADPHAPQLGAHAKSEFKRAGLQHELGHETNNIAIAINGKTWKVVPCKGTADSPEEWQYLRHMKDWAEKKSASSGKKWSVHLTGAPLSESTGPGVTNAASVGVGPVYKNKPPKQPKNKDGTAKNALDMDANLMTGESIKR